MSVAYVFLHLLPEIAQGNVAIGELLSDVLDPTPLFELAIFAVALAGFTFFYGLRRLARRGRSGGTTAGVSEPAVSVYALHVGSFAVYNALITYTMPLRLQTGVSYALLFTVAMGLHFVLTDRALEEQFPRRFDNRGRYLLAGGLLGGWGAVALLAPSSTLVVALLTGFLGGSILLNVFTEELPGDRRSSFGWFLTGLTVYTVLLAVVTAMSEAG